MEVDEDENFKRKIRNIWIVKPGEISNRGNGITVCDELGEIKEILKSNVRQIIKFFRKGTRMGKR